MSENVNRWILRDILVEVNCANKILRRIFNDPETRLTINATDLEYGHRFRVVLIPNTDTYVRVEFESGIIWHDGMPSKYLHSAIGLALARFFEDATLPQNIRDLLVEKYDESIPLSFYRVRSFSI